MQRNWEGLSSSYRRRLERGGITKIDYESGVSLKRARGHANDLTKRALASKIESLVTEYHGNSNRFNGDALKNNLNKAKTDTLRNIWTRVEQELDDPWQLADTEDEKDALHYHADN